MADPNLPPAELPAEMQNMEAFKVSERDQKIIDKAISLLEKSPDKAIANAFRTNCMTVFTNKGIPALHRVNYASSVVSQITVELE